MPRKVRAAVAFAPHEALRIVDVELADPGPGQVLVRFFATGLCHSDLHIIDGLAAARFPVILGHEGIGEVLEVGDGVAGFAPGDRVIPYLVPDCGACGFCRSGRTNLCVRFQERLQSGASCFNLDGQPVAQFMAIGSFAEMAVIEADQLAKVAMQAPTDLACCIACAVTTGLGAATISARVQPGESVAVFGAGGVGLSVIQGAKLSGAATIIAIDTNPRKREPALAHGATHFIDASTDDPVAEVQRLTGFGADHTFECVGIPALAQTALAAANPAWGSSIVVGVMPSDSLLSTAPFNLMTGRRWTGSFMGGAKRQDVVRFVDMLVAGDFSLAQLVSHRLGLDEINRGFAMMKSGEAVRSVVIYAAP